MGTSPTEVRRRHHKPLPYAEFVGISPGIGTEIKSAEDVRLDALELSRLVSRDCAVRRCHAGPDVLDEEGEPPKMTRSILIVIAVGVFVSVIAGPGCAPGGVGDPCIPEAEYDTCFPGFSITDVITESRSFQCQTRLCLVNHFQGRVSCPYGQTAGTATVPPCSGGTTANCCSDGTSAIGGQPITSCTSSNPSPFTNTGAPWCTGANAPPTCTIPGGATVLSNATAGVAAEYAIQVTVQPQETPRQASNAVYCSCRCQNAQGQTNDGDVYCQCPDGYVCQQLVTSIPGGGNADLAGGYCIKDHTDFNMATATPTPCTVDTVAANPCQSP